MSGKSEVPQKKMSIDETEAAVLNYLYEKVDENGLDWSTTVEELHSNLSSSVSANLSRGRLDLSLSRLETNNLIHTSRDDWPPFTIHVSLDGDYFAARTYEEDEEIPF